MRNHVRRPKRLLAGFLAAVLAITVMPFLGFNGVASAQEVADPTGEGNFCEDVPQTEPFTDVQETDPSYEEIVCLVATEITTGVTATTYEPNSFVTRRQMALFLVRLANEANRLEIDDLVNELPEPADNEFPDVEDEEQFIQDAISQISQAGVAQGFPDGTYRPATEVSRRQMAAFIDRLYEYLTGEELPATEDHFADDDADSAEAQESTNAVAEAGIFIGNEDGTFRPADPISRRQMANVITRTLQVLMENGYITQWKEEPAPGESFTDAPELVSAEFVRTNEGGDHIYRFTFDEAISPLMEDGVTDAIDETLFHVHSWNGDNVYGTSAAQDPDDDASVLVVFDGGSIAPDRVSRAAVDAGAVIGHTDDPTDDPDLGPLPDDDDTNVEDYVEVQDISFAAGETDSPDLMTVDNLRVFNSAEHGWHIRADFTFDQPAYDDGACVGDMGLIMAQPGTAQGLSTWGENRLVSDDCVGDPDGTSTWTAIFPEDGDGTPFANEADVQAAIAQVRRGLIADDSYHSADNVEGVSRHVVVTGTDGMTVGPDAVSATIVNGVQMVGAAPADPTFDAVDITFDEDVDILEDWAPCTVYKRFADEPIWATFAEHPGDDDSVVRCYFDLGELDELVAGTVHGGSFVASQSTGFYAPPGEIRFGTLDLEPDTTAPTLVDTNVTQTDEVVFTDPITNVETVRGRTFTVVFTFDRDLDLAGSGAVGTPADFGLYFEDGERRDMTTCVYGDSDTPDSGEDNQVICSETEGDMTDPPIAGPAADDLREAVLGGVASESVESADFDGAMNHAASAA